MIKLIEFALTVAIIVIGGAVSLHYGAKFADWLTSLRPFIIDESHESATEAWSPLAELGAIEVCPELANAVTVTLPVVPASIEDDLHARFDEVVSRLRVELEQVVERFRIELDQVGALDVVRQ